jgi:prepilin-type N-terminal cleavage/methylation domain-containing protein
MPSRTPSARTSRAARSRAAFSLVELLVVVAIIGILAAIALPRVGSARGRATRAAGLADLHQVATAQEAFFADSNRYAALADTALLRLTLSRGNTGLVLAPDGTGWHALLQTPGGTPCAIRTGTAGAPPGWAGPALADGAPTCATD